MKTLIGFGDSGLRDFDLGDSGLCSRESRLGVWESLESLWESCIWENLVWEIFVNFLVTFLIPDSGFGSQLESSMVPHQA